MLTFSDEIIVLRVYEISEADRIAICYGKEKGKISCIAKGARKAGNRLSGSVQPLTFGVALMAAGKTFNTITQFETVEANLLIKNDFLKQSIGLVFAEAIDIAIESECPTNGLYELAENAFAALKITESNSMVLYSFLLQLLAITGFQPELAECIQCGAVIDTEQSRISVNEGGAFCLNCCDSRDDSIIIDHKTSFQLKSMQALSWQSAEQNNFYVTRKAALCVERFCECSWGKGLKSLAFLKKTFGIE